MTATTITKEYYSICPQVFQRKRTSECERDALDMLRAYRDFNKITECEYRETKKRIKKAEHDDAISNIMCKIRHKIKW